MTTYLLLAAGAALPVTAAGAFVLVRHGRLIVLAGCAALLVLVVLTIVFDGVIVGTGIVAYHEDRILGARIGVAPIEDFAYPLAAATALPAIWLLLSRSRARRR